MFTYAYVRTRRICKPWNWDISANFCHKIQLVIYIILPVASTHFLRVRVLLRKALTRKDLNILCSSSKIFTDCKSLNRHTKNGERKDKPICTILHSLELTQIDGRTCLTNTRYLVKLTASKFPSFTKHKTLHYSTMRDPWLGSEHPNNNLKYLLVFLLTPKWLPAQCLHCFLHSSPFRIMESLVLYSDSLLWLFRVRL